ncbi:MAG: LysM peptidoglycan-binding domain-containing protein, partial [Clostridiales bacterium]|nr:LysM peptidoglycan-binding domain-containing protein [Clostridiales bacterium]
MVIHTVQSGETIQSIARQYGVPPGRIINDNELESPETLVPGQTLVILFPSETYVVQGGDTLYTIAREFGVSVNQLWRNNPSLGGMSAVYPGQVLVISYNQPKIGTIYTNGYAYPFIDRAILRKTLPYLSYLSIFTYGITNDGMLIPADDQEIINIAHEYGVAPLMMLSSLTEEGTFSNELAMSILENPELQARLIEQIYQVVTTKRYAGVDVDFEYIPRQNADQYVNFIANLRRRLAPEGYVVFVALAPKSSENQPGLLYEGHKYAELGAVADSVLVMTYEWGYTFGPPMAVAPLDQVRMVIDFAVTQIRPGKIFMGMPNYGYDWPLPYIRGTTMARALSNVEAVNLARQQMVPIRFDPIAKAPFF